MMWHHFIGQTKHTLQITSSTYIFFGGGGCAKLQTIPLKFGDVWIFHLEESKFRIYPWSFI